MSAPTANSIRSTPWPGTRSEEPASLSLEGQPVELPVIVGSEGEKAIDISRLRSGTGYITLDEGYVNTGSTTSGITFLNGEKGVLRYRGYPIEDLAARCDFIEVAYLLIYGELPTKDELATFRHSLSNHSMIHEDMRSFYSGFPRDAHPMAIVGSVVGALSTFYQDSLDVRDPKQVEVSVHRLLAKLPTIAAYSYKKSIGQPLIYPRNDRSYCENFLQMMFAVPCEEYEIDPDFAEALDMLLIVHADHEQNCSTSTVRMVGSSDANLFASISAGVSALWGPLHGGANQACVEMLEQIVADGGNVKKYVELAKKKDSGFRLMGFGHRVYKNYDPRATLIKASCDKLLAKIDRCDPLFDIAQQLEEVARGDDYFIERNCTRMSISTPVLSIVRWAYRNRCLRFFLQWDAFPDGLPTGWKCTEAQQKKSAGRDKCIQVRHFVNLSRSIRDSFGLSLQILNTLLL